MQEAAGKAWRRCRAHVSSASRWKWNAGALVVILRSPESGADSGAPRDFVELASARIAAILEFGAIEAKNKLGMFLDKVEQGEEIVITRHGKAIARLVPNTERMDSSRALAALKRIRGRVHETKQRFNWETLKKDRDGGRP
jgi:prevent-host-death family protein